MLPSPRARKLAIAAATLGLTAGLVPHAMAFPLLGDILSGHQTDCSAAGNSGEIAPSGHNDSLNGLSIINAGNGTTNNNCSALSGNSILSGNSLFANGLFGAPSSEVPPSGATSPGGNSVSEGALSGGLLSGNNTNCSAAGNSGEIHPSGFNGSANGLEIINAGNEATNNNCSVLSGNSILSGNSLFSNGLFGGPLVNAPINILNGGDAGDGGTAGNGGGNILVAPLTGIGINQCTTVSVLLGLGSDAGCSNGLGIINMFNGFGGF